MSIDCRIQGLFLYRGPMNVALGDGSTKALKHNSTQNDLPEELFCIRQASLELFYEG